MHNMNMTYTTNKKYLKTMNYKLSRKIFGPTEKKEEYSE